MSDKDNEYKGSSFWQLMIIIPGTILAFTLLIALIAKGFGILGTEEKESPAAVAEVDANINPVASVDVTATDGEGAKAKSGEEVYNSVCMMCHQTGLMAAPIFGDKEQWKPRIAQGYDTLVSHAINGIRNMPAKGGNPSLSDDEVASAVVHIANAAGADFKAPAANEVKSAEGDSSEPVASNSAGPVAAEATTGKSGEDVYKSVCMMCHQAGLMAAPIFGDKEQWKPRIAQGYDTLVTHAVKGVRNMPAKGGNPGLSDDEVASAVKYMANASGASF